MLGPGTITEGAPTETYSTHPSSIIFDILAPDRDTESSDDGLMPPNAYHCSCESLTAFVDPQPDSRKHKPQPPLAHKMQSPHGFTVQKQHCW